MAQRTTRLSVQSFLLQHRAGVRRSMGAAIILGVSAVLVPRAVQGDPLPLLLIAGSLGIAGTAVLLKWPGVGFPVLVFATLLVPFRLGTGTLTGINISLILVGGLTALWLIDMLVRHQRIAFLNSRTVAPTLAFVVVAVLSLGFGQFDWLPAPGASLNAQLGGLSVFVLSACAFLLAAHQISRVGELQWMAWLLIVLGGFYVAALFMPGIARMAHRTYGRAVQDSLFWTWLVAQAVSQALINRRLPLGVRLGLVGLAGATMYINIVVKQGWTSGWFPALTAAYVIVLLRFPRLGLLLGLLGGMGLVVSNIFLAGDNAYSLTTRLEAWRILFELIKRNPILGLGPANYYFYTQFYEILGYYVRFNSHNNYIDIVAQIGFAGLLCFFWLMGEIGWVAWQLRRRVPVGFPEAYVYGTIGGLAGTLVAGMLGDWVLPFVYNIGLEGFRASVLAWLFLGGVVALGQIFSVQKQKPDAILPAGQA